MVCLCCVHVGKLWIVFSYDGSGCQTTNLLVQVVVMWTFMSGQSLRVQTLKLAITLGPLAWAAMSTTEIGCMVQCAWRQTNNYTSFCTLLPSCLSVCPAHLSTLPPSFPLSSLLSKQRDGWGPSLTEAKIWGGGASPIPDWHQTSSTECDGVLSEPLLQWCCPASANYPHGTLWASTWKRTIPGWSTCKLVTR